MKPLRKQGQKPQVPVVFRSVSTDLLVKDKQHLSISEAVTLGIEDGIKPMRSGVSIQIEKGE
jgi:hypothetical protein